MARNRPVLPALVLLLALAMAARSQDILIAAAGSHLLAAPQSDAQVVATLGGGERLTVIDTEGGWSRVETWARSGRGFIDRLEGWLRTDQLPAAGAVETLVAPGPPPTPAAASASGPPAEHPAPVVVTVSGTPALLFSGDCRIVGEDGRQRRRTFRGTVPKRYAFAGRTLSCRFEKQDFRGRLRADLYIDDELRAWARTLAPLNWILVRSDGPWGEAAGVEGDRRVLVRGVERPGRRSSGPSRIVPPLSGTIIPPIVPERP